MRSEFLFLLFPVLTAYCECLVEDGIPASKLGDGGYAAFQITFHPDHLLYDSLVSQEPLLLLPALADADADVGGNIPQPGPAATDIGAYDPGSEDGVDDLWAWLLAQTRTLGHVDGEGHCRATPAN